MQKTFALAFLALTASATAAAAQTPACDGHFELIRTDTIKPGKMDLFKKAVADHQAWYTAHKLPDHILLGQILQPKGAATPFSETTAITIHTDAAGPGAPPHEGDAAWDQYVAEYKASSDVVSSITVCVTSPH